MTKDNKKVLFTNEVLYERNISDRVWPAFLEAQIQQDLQKAILATKMYYLFTQQWYPKQSKDIAKRIREIKLLTKPQTTKQLLQSQMLKDKAWITVEEIWCDISDYLENYGIFKRNFTPDSTAMALPMR